MTIFSTHTDQDLLRAMKRDDLGAFNEIFKRYWSRLYIYACNVLEDHQACEDIVQDIFVYLYAKKKELKIDNLKSYLFQAVKFQVIKHLRKRKLAQNHIERMNVIEFASQTEELINFKELEASMNKYLAELPARCKEIFYLSRYEHLSHLEISERLNISTQTVKNQITKALNYLRSKFDYIGILSFVIPWIF